MSAIEFEPASVRGKTIRDIIDHWAETQPDRPYLIDPDRNISLDFRQLQSRCRGIAGRLAEVGARPGDAIAYAMNNGADAAMVILGAMYGGFIATAVNLVSGETTIAHVLNHSGSQIVIVDDQNKEMISAVLVKKKIEANILQMNEQWFEKSSWQPAALSADDHALLMYTSGTTGLPKGVVHTHSSLIAGGSNTAFAHRIHSGDRALCVLPLFHINGLCVTLLGALVSGGSVIMPERFSIGQFWQWIREYRCSWFSVVPTQISYLLNQAKNVGHDGAGLEKLKFGRSASAPLAPEVQQAFEERFSIPIIETMGLTETAAQILSNPMDGPRKIGSPGIAYGNEVIIADENQLECQRGIEGEVLVRGENVMQEYRNNPDATSDAITSEGWLRTGDLGKMDDDGYVYITGRLKELIIKGGENIAPREVDEALYCHPDVIEAAAFARQSERYGQAVEAGVSIRPGANVEMDELIRLCQEKIGQFKTPDFIHFLPELPKGPSGKIQRLKLAELTETRK